METVNATEFSSLARRLAAVAHHYGLLAPGFRTPPRVPGRPRTVRRYRDGSALVSVVARDRDRDIVMSDMIEGVLVANHLTGSQGDTIRAALWSEMTNGPTPRAA